MEELQFTPQFSIAIESNGNDDEQSKQYVAGFNSEFTDKWVDKDRMFGIVRGMEQSTRRFEFPFRYLIRIKDNWGYDVSVWTRFPLDSLYDICSFYSAHASSVMFCCGYFGKEWKK